MPKKPQKPEPPETVVFDAPTHTAWAVSQTCDVSLRQLQWWDEQGIVSPIIIDHKRMYTDAELEKVRRLGQLSRAGVQVHRAKQYLKWEYSDVRRIWVPTVINGVLVIPK